MKTVVITGSTRGIGLGMAQAFLARGCQVVISGRKAESVEQAVADLSRQYSADAVLGIPCDVTHLEQVQALWDATVEHFGKVDIWINNAGLATNLTDFWEHEEAQMQVVVNTNILGSMYGAKVALRGMLRQGFGGLYNMEGFGSHGGRTMRGMTLYGTTKAATAYLTRSLAQEVEGTPIIVGSLSPGMVVTDMLLNQRKGDPKDWERSKRAFNILADRVETVVPWLVNQVLENRQNGKRIRWLTGGKIMTRFLSAPFTKRRVIDE